MKPLLKKIKVKANSKISNLKLGELNITTQRFWKIRLLAIFLVLIIAGIFKFVPAVEHARYTIPPEVFEGGAEKYDCQYILDNRPWYSKFNYGFWLWIIITPLLISFVKTTMPKWQKIILTTAIIGICYILIFFDVILVWNITNDIFIRGQGALDMDFINNCASTNDGAAFTTTIVLGWIPASLYVGFWFFIRWCIIMINYYASKYKLKK